MSRRYQPENDEDFEFEAVFLREGGRAYFVEHDELGELCLGQSITTIEPVKPDESIGHGVLVNVTIPYWAAKQNDLV